MTTSLDPVKPRTGPQAQNRIAATADEQLKRVTEIPKIDAETIIASLGWDPSGIRARYARIMGRIDSAADGTDKLQALTERQEFFEELRFGFILAFTVTDADGYSEHLRRLFHQIVGNDFQTQRSKHMKAHAESMTTEQRRAANDRWEDFRKDNLAEIKFQISELADEDPEFLTDIVDRVYGPTVGEALRDLLVGEVDHRG